MRRAGNKTLFTFVELLLHKKQFTITIIIIIIIEMKSTNFKNYFNVTFLPLHFNVKMKSTNFKNYVNVTFLPLYFNVAFTFFKRKVSSHQNFLMYFVFYIPETSNFTRFLTSKIKLIMSITFMGITFMNLAMHVNEFKSKNVYNK